MPTTVRPSDGHDVAEVYSATLLFLGISMVVLGVVAVLTSILFTIGTVLVLAGILLAAGVVECIHAFKAAKKHQKNVFLNALSALLYLMLGAIMLSNPVAGAMSLTLVLSAFLLVNGVVSITNGVRHRAEPLWGWFFFGGLVDIILGVLIALGWPGTSLWVIGLFVGIEMFIYGAAWIAMSLTFKEIEQELQKHPA